MDIYSFMESIEPQSFVGVDALTFTGKSPLSMIGVRALLAEALPDVELDPQKPFVYNGAKGFSQGKIAYASKLDTYGKAVWAIVMIKGARATQFTKWQALDLKTTRLDLRVDVVMQENCPNLAERIFRICDKQGRLIDSLVGQTYYPTENRAGTFYGRIYDKSPEYGEDWGKVWRWEVEIKRNAPDSITQTLNDCHDVAGFIEETVFGVFSEQWGVPTPKPGTVPVINYLSAGVISPEQKLDWIRRNVAKTVKHLKRVGFTEELEQLFAI